MEGVHGESTYAGSSMALSQVSPEIAVMIIVECLQSQRAVNRGSAAIPELSGTEIRIINIAAYDNIQILRGQVSVPDPIPEGSPYAESGVHPMYIARCYHGPLPTENGSAKEDPCPLVLRLHPDQFEKLVDDIEIQTFGGEDEVTDRKEEQ